MNAKNQEILFYVLLALCVLASYISYRIGYSKKERERLKEQKRIWKEHERTLPRAINHPKK